MSEQDYILIRKYLLDEIKNGEKADFENRMKSDLELKQTVADFRVLMKGRSLEKNEVFDFDDGLPPLDADLSTQLDKHLEQNRASFEKRYNEYVVPETEYSAQKNKTVAWRPIFAVAASIVFFLTAGLVVYNFWFSVSPKEEMVLARAEAHYEVVMGRGHEGWKTAYRNKNYRETIELLSSVNETNNEETFFLGLSYLYSKEYSKSILHLKNAKSVESKYTEHAKWYLSLGYYLNGEENLSKNIWKEIASTHDDFWSKEATELLDER